MSDISRLENETEQIFWGKAIALLVSIFVSV